MLEPLSSNKFIFEDANNLKVVNCYKYLFWNSSKFRLSYVHLDRKSFNKYLSKIDV